MINNIGSAISDAGNSVVEGATNIGNGIGSAINDAGEIVTNVASNIGNTVVDGANAVVKGVCGLISICG